MQGTKSGLWWGWVAWVICFTKKLCTRCDAWAGTLSWWSYQSPDAHSCGLLNHPNSFHGRLFKLNAKSDVDSLFYLLSHFECDGYPVHMLTQQYLPPPLTSTVKLSFFTYVHSRPLSLAARWHQFMQTVLVILTMDGIFPEGPCHINSIMPKTYLILKMYLLNNKWISYTSELEWQTSGLW